MLPATRPGQSCSAAIPGCCTRRAGTPPGLYGAVGAAAACASLRRLDADKAAQAIALGASQSAGLMANFGTMTKPFHAGKAAHAGIMAARLAEAGFTANTDALEHPQGFLSAISPEGNRGPHQRGEGRRGLGDPDRRASASRNTPPATARIARSTACSTWWPRRRSRPDEVKKITVNISDYFATVLRNHQPETGLAAKFSMEFAMASGIIAQACRPARADRRIRAAPRHPAADAAGRDRHHQRIRSGTRRAPRRRIR